MANSRVIKTDLSQCGELARFLKISERVCTVPEIELSRLLLDAQFLRIFNSKLKKFKRSNGLVDI